MQMQPTTQQPSRVLVVEPHPTLRTVLVHRLRQDGHLTAAVATA
ncbi:MAG: DNA-binding response regulator, partial [Prochlorococcaceae cyanobacterium ETNP2_MAG_10]|nr:DNA-binding response regulator [Prochlorococcaceae cyanobacterium ETNP2_MAG_10]